MLQRKCIHKLFCCPGIYESKFILGFVLQTALTNTRMGNLRTVHNNNGVRVKIKLK